MRKVIWSATTSAVILLTTLNLHAAELMTATESAAAICDKSVTSTSLVQNAVKQADAANALNAIITLDADGALAAAKAIDNADDETRCMPLAGVPIVIKDNTHVMNLPSTAGTTALKDFIPKEDAPVVAKLREAGAVILAKTNMHELAFGISGHNPVFQSGSEAGVRNAYNVDFVAGGSSSGTAAALGARIVAAGITIDELAMQIASPDVKGTYDGLVLPRKLPTPDNTLIDAEPVYNDAITNGLPALQEFYAQLFSENNIEAIVFPTVPIVAMPAGPESSGLEYFGLVIQNTDPAGNAGIPGIQIPAGLGSESGLPVGIELDGPAGSDRRLIELGLAIETLLGRLPAPAL